MTEKIMPNDLINMKEEDEKITVLTAYDYPIAKILDSSGIDVILVGDSVGNTILGYDSTLPVTMDDMVHHTKAVARGVENSLLVADMPFKSYQVSDEKAVKNACRLVKQAGAEAVKLEGGAPVLSRVRQIVEAGIPVMGHLGLTPQYILQFGGYGVRGKDSEEAQEIFEDAVRLQEAGVFSLVLESVPRELADMVTEELEIPVIGIGAGPGCDGQVLVSNDILGLSDLSPSFVKKYEDVGESVEKAVEEYISEVKEGDFPSSEHSSEMEKPELEKFKDNLNQDS